MTSKVALVTGSAQRIGAAIARLLHQQGYNLVLHYGQSATHAQELEKELNGIRSGSANRIQADLSKMADLGKLADDTLKCWERLDVLVNNASRFYPTELGSITEEDWDDLLNSNLRAPLFLSQALAPALKKQGGCIVNLVDIYSERPLKGYPVYNISKAGMAMLTKTLAAELGPEIRVNGVSPGAVLWPQHTNQLNEEAQQGIINRTALKAAGSPGDVCNAVLFLIEKAAYITGQVIAVDGGRNLNQ